MRGGIATLLLFLCACDQVTPSEEKAPVEQPSLEQAAIEMGVIPDAKTVSLAGAFERESDLGTDRFCAVGSDETGFQVGMIAVFGPDSKCEALGEADRTGESVRITLTNEKPCSFSASFDGVELKLPGRLPEGCASYCTPRAGFDGVSFYLIGEGNAVARSTQGRDIKSLCPSG